jgi:putative ABC transport system substrate-binding protein
MKRRAFITLLGGAAAAWPLFSPLGTRAQQPFKTPVLGYVSGTGTASDQGPFFQALRQGLREFGYIEGENIKIEYRGAEGEADRIPSLVVELLQLKPDVLIVPISSAVRAAKQATKTTPVVMVTSLDPVANGFVESLAHPGGNITGLSTLTLDLSGKRLELLKELAPGMSRVGVLRDADEPVTAISLKEYEAAAGVLGIQLEPVNVHGPNPDLDLAFQAAARGAFGALINVTSALLYRYRKQIAELAIKYRLPTISQGATWVEAGGLMSYSADDLEAFRRAAYYVDKILKGSKPADLPIEQPTKFELVINLKTARALGITVPTTLLVAADRVIE